MKRPIKKLNGEMQLRLKRKPVENDFNCVKLDWYLLSAVDCYLKEYGGEGYDTETFIDFFNGWMQRMELIPRKK